MITVHYLEESRAHRLLWLLEEIGLDYQVRLYRRDENLGAPPELKAVHPLGKSPVIEMNGKVLAESGAIFETLCDAHPQSNLLPPPDSPERFDHVYWLHYAEGTAMPPLVDKLIFDFLPTRVPALIRPIARLISNGMNKARLEPELANQFRFWEETLSKTGWFAGEAFSAADMMMSYPVEVAMQRSEISDSPAITAWLAAIRARPAYQRALEKGGAYGLSDYS